MGKGDPAVLQQYQSDIFDRDRSGGFFLIGIGDHHLIASHTQVSRLTKNQSTFDHLYCILKINAIKILQKAYQTTKNTAYNGNQQYFTHSILSHLNHFAQMIETEFDNSC